MLLFMFRTFTKRNAGKCFWAPKAWKMTWVWDVYFSAWKLEKVFAGSTTVQGSGAAKLHLPTCEKHILYAGLSRGSSTAELDVECYDLWGEWTATTFTDKGGGGHLHSKTSLVRLRATRVPMEGALCDIIYSEKAIRARLKILLPKTPSASPVVEDPKLGLALHLLPLIRYCILSANSINFSSPWLLLASITHNTLQVIYTDY